MLKDSGRAICHVLQYNYNFQDVPSLLISVVKNRLYNWSFLISTNIPVLQGSSNISDLQLERHLGIKRETGQKWTHALLMLI